MQHADRPIPQHKRGCIGFGVSERYEPKAMKK